MRVELRRAAVVAACCAAAAYAADWPNWRGPNHDGISPETGLKTDWDQPLTLLWQREIGSAFSSFACVGGKVYTCGTEDERQVLFCLNADSGDVVWKKPFEEAYRERQGGDGARATPAVDQGRVYVLGARGTLACLDAATGSELWSHRLSHMPQWGYSGSVLIEGDKAIVSAGGSDGGLAAFHKVTGEPVWKCGEDVVGYATPYPFTFNEKRYVAGFMGNCALIADADTGREVWRMPWQTDWDVNASSPIFHAGCLFFSSGYRHGCILLKLRPDGDKLAADTVWDSRVLRNKFQSCVLYDGHLYTSDETGAKCVEFLTGREKWSKHRVNHGTVVIAQGHLFVLTESGTLMIAPATPDGFNPTAEAEILDGRCWTVPTLYNGRIYARDLTRVVCFSLTE